MRRAILAIAAFAALAGAPQASATPWITWDGRDPATAPYFGVATGSGIYYIARRCFVEPPDGSRLGADMGLYGNHVGPGYVFASAAIEPDGSSGTKTRDYLDVSHSDPRNGGWGKFGVHVARTGGYPDAPTSMKELSTGICRPDVGAPGDPGEPGDPFYKAGVSRVADVVGPYVAGSEAVFEITVYLHDGLSEVLAVRYRYRIDDTRVRLWTSVRGLCPSGVCSAGGAFFVKEPKFSTSTYAYSPNDGTSWSNYVYALGVAVFQDNTWNYACWNDARTIYRVRSDVADPRVGTLHCADYVDPLRDEWKWREQVWFKYGDNGQIPNDCYRRCTWVIAKAASSDDPATATIAPWTQSGYGLDQWGRDASSRRAFGSENACSASTEFRSVRRWELIGWGHFAPTPSPDGTESLQVSHHGWTGGTGLTDCQNLFRLGGSATYANYFTFEYR